MRKWGFWQPWAGAGRPEIDIMDESDGHLPTNATYLRQVRGQTGGDDLHGRLAQDVVMTRW